MNLQRHTDVWFFSDLTAEEQMEIERLKMHKQILLEDIEVNAHQLLHITSHHIHT